RSADRANVSPSEAGANRGDRRRVRELPGRSIRRRLGLELERGDPRLERRDAVLERLDVWGQAQAVIDDRVQLAHARSNALVLEIDLVDRGHPALSLRALAIFGELALRELLLGALDRLGLGFHARAIVALRFERGLIDAAAESRMLDGVGID